MPIKLRNQLLIPKERMRVLFEDEHGSAWDILVLGVGKGSVEIEYVENGRNSVLNWDEWQNMVQDRRQMSRIIEVSFG